MTHEEIRLSPTALLFFKSPGGEASTINFVLKWLIIKEWRVEICS
jgi:hypothetical protein